MNSFSATASSSSATRKGGAASPTSVAHGPGTEETPPNSLPKFTGNSADIGLITDDAKTKLLQPATSGSTTIPQTLLHDLKERFTEIENKYAQLPNGLAKDTMKTEIQTALKTLSTELANSSFLQSPQTDAQDTQRFLTQTTLGKLTVATYLHADTAHTLPSTCYSDDLMSATTPIIKDLYPDGLCQALETSTTLSTTDKLEKLKQFEAPQGNQHPLDKPETYAPFVEEQRSALLANQATVSFQDYPVLATTVKNGLSQSISAKLTNNSTWATELQRTVRGSHDKQWQTQFQGFEKDLLDGLCAHLDKKPKENTPDMLAFSMSVADACNDPAAYGKVIARTTDDQLCALVGRTDVKEMIRKTPQWGTAIGARLESMDQAAHTQTLQTAMTMDITVPKTANKLWVSALNARRSDFLTTAFKTSTESLLSALKDHPIAVNHSDRPEYDFCTAVDRFCDKPTPAALTELYSTATTLKNTFDKTSDKPLALTIRIALIEGIHNNLKATVASNLSTADLGVRKWTFTPPMTVNSNPKSSYAIALKAFTADTDKAKPTTLQDHVKLLAHDGQAKADKYDAQSQAMPNGYSSIHTAMSQDATAFQKAMEKISTQLDQQDITAVRQTIQSTRLELMKTNQTFKDTVFYTKTEDAAQIKRLAVLKEMIQTCTRLDKGISTMIAADAALDAPPAETVLSKLPSLMGMMGTKAAKNEMKDLQKEIDATRQLTNTNLPQEIDSYKHDKSTTEAEIDQLKTNIQELETQISRATKQLKLQTQIDKLRLTLEPLQDAQTVGQKINHAIDLEVTAFVREKSAPLIASAKKNRELSPFQLPHKISAIPAEVELDHADTITQLRRALTDKISQETKSAIDALNGKIDALETKKQALKPQPNSDQQTQQTSQTPIDELKLTLQEKNDTLKSTKQSLVKTKILAELESKKTALDTDIKTADEAYQAQQQKHANIRKLTRSLDTINKIIDLALKVPTEDLTKDKIQAAIDTNATQMSDTETKRLDQTTRTADITAQETEFQSHLKPRLDNLITKQNNIRYRLEAGTFLGYPDSNNRSNAGDQLPESDQK